MPLGHCNGSRRSLRLVRQRCVGWRGDVWVLGRRRRHQRRGQVPVAFLTVRAGARVEVDFADRVKAHVADTIARMARAAQVHVIDAMPKTRSGKIVRRLLRELVVSGTATGDTPGLKDPNLWEPASPAGSPPLKLGRFPQCRGGSGTPHWGKAGTGAGKHARPHRSVGSRPAPSRAAGGRQRARGSAGRSYLNGWASSGLSDGGGVLSPARRAWARGSRGGPAMVVPAGSAQRGSAAGCGRCRAGRRQTFLAWRSGLGATPAQMPAVAHGPA